MNLALDPRRSARSVYVAGRVARSASRDDARDAAPATPSTIRIPSVSTRVRTVVRSLSRLARDPSRLEEVLVLAQTVNLPAVARAMTRIDDDEAGRALLRDQPRIDRKSVDFAALRALPDGTLGREYARFLDDNGITPDAFESLPDIGDERAAYVMLRMRQTHDLWHVLTGYTPDVRGEVLLQAFTYGQTHAPSSLIIALFGTVRWAFQWPQQTRALREAFERGERTGFLATFRWEKHWATPVTELRTLLACPPAVVFRAAA
ncbi:MAG: ubiquinone biosynthesis protein [Myxococcales bacterium]|nr:ubiquinone biosynthesis protein [Myxococcales bacterium]